VLRVTSEKFKGKYRCPFSASWKFIPCGHIYGTTHPYPLRNTSKSFDRQASRRHNEEWKENNARQGMNTPYFLLERSINSISRTWSIITMSGCFLDTLICFDRRNVKFMTYRAISTAAVKSSIIIKNWLTTGAN